MLYIVSKLRHMCIGVHSFQLESCGQRDRHEHCSNASSSCMLPSSLSFNLHDSSVLSLRFISSYECAFTSHLGFSTGLDMGHKNQYLLTLLLRGWLLVQYRAYPLDASLPCGNYFSKRHGSIFTSERFASFRSMPRLVNTAATGHHDLKQ